MIDPKRAIEELRRIKSLPRGPNDYAASVMDAACELGALAIEMVEAARAADDIGYRNPTCHDPYTRAQDAYLALSEPPHA